MKMKNVREVARLTKLQEEKIGEKIVLVHTLAHLYRTHQTD